MKLESILKDKGISERKGDAYKNLLNSNRDAAFYESKITTASFFMNHVLPQALAIRESIETGDISPVKMREDLF